MAGKRLDIRNDGVSRRRAAVPQTPRAGAMRTQAGGIYENVYVREDGCWKIQGITVTMTYYASHQRERVSFPTAPPSGLFPPDRASQPIVESLGRQFNLWH